MHDGASESGNERQDASPNHGDERSFPTNAVVGIIDDPHDIPVVVDELRSAGLEPDVLCGERGIERIEHAGGTADEVRMIRAVQGVFGFEADHAARHQSELDAGHFVVVVESRDEGTTERARSVFADHGGHFVNYYGKWSGHPLIP